MTSNPHAHTGTASKDYDAIIIGAGIIGCCTGYELAKRGYRTLNLDKLHGAGYGSTAASCAIIRFHYSTPDGVALARESYFHWLDWGRYLGAGSGSHAIEGTEQELVGYHSGTRHDGRSLHERAAIEIRHGSSFDDNVSPSSASVSSGSPPVWQPSSDREGRPQVPVGTRGMPTVCVALDQVASYPGSGENPPTRRG